jgi:hypothetical protein
MQTREFDHVLTLKITAEMRDEIHEALARMKHLPMKTRSEFFRMAAMYALASMKDRDPKH